MAIKLESKTNVTPPGGAYPYGKIKDDTGIGDGTPVSDQVYGDFHQFFARMLSQAGIAGNNLPDNSTNGFQYFEAFAKLCALGFPGDGGGAWISAPTAVFTPDVGSVSLFSTSYNKYKIIGKTFIWQAVLSLTVNSGSPTLLTLPWPPGITSASASFAQRKSVGWYKINTQMAVTATSAGLTFVRLDPSFLTFSGSAQPFSFEFIIEIN